MNRATALGIALLTARSVWPSGDDRTRVSDAIIPLAPGRLSAMTC